MKPLASPDKNDWLCEGVSTVHSTFQWRPGSFNWRWNPFWSATTLASILATCNISFACREPSLKLRWHKRASDDDLEYAWNFCKVNTTKMKTFQEFFPKTDLFSCDGSSQYSIANFARLVPSAMAEDEFKCYWHSPSCKEIHLLVTLVLVYHQDRYTKHLKSKLVKIYFYSM